MLSIHVIDENRLLVGCVDGLFELTIQSKYAYSYRLINYFNDEQTALKHARIYSIVPYKENQYFLATKTGVVLVDLKKKKAQAFEHNPKKIRETIGLGVCRMAFKDKRNRIFFAPSSGGLSQLVDKNGELKIIPYQFNSKLTTNTKDYISSVC